MLPVQAFLWIADLHGPVEAFAGAANVAIRKDGKGLSAMEGKKSITDPSAGESAKASGGARDSIGDEGGKGVAGVVVRVAVVAFEVEGVLRELPAELSHFIQVVAPGVDGLHGDAVEVLDAELSLQGVVV